MRQQLETIQCEIRQRRELLGKRLEEVARKEHQLIDAHLYRGKLAEDAFARESGLLASERRAIEDEMEKLEAQLPGEAEILQFAADCLARADSVWEMAPPDIRRKFQALAFPGGLTFSGGAFGTPALSRIFELIGSYEASKGGLASPSGHVSNS